MTLKTKTYPIVGIHYRPPAETLVGSMKAGTRLWLVAEPFNEHDKNAIAVWCDLEAALESNHVVEALAKTQNTDWMGKKSIQIGYLPRPAAAYLKSKGFPHEVEGKFTIPMNSNLPHIRFEFDES